MTAALIAAYERAPFEPLHKNDIRRIIGTRHVAGVHPFEIVAAEIVIACAIERALFVIPPLAAILAASAGGSAFTASGASL